MCDAVVPRRTVDDRKTIQLGLGRVRVFVPGDDGRFRLNVSCVRQRSDNGVVRKPTTSIFLRAPRSKCLMGESRRPLRADESRSHRRVSESPTYCDLTGWSDCLHQRVIHGAAWDSVGDSFAQRSRSVPRRSLTGSPGTTAATFRKRPSRGMNHFSWHVAWYFSSLQFVCWSSVERAEPSESSVANLRTRRLVGTEWCRAVCRRPDRVIADSL